MDLWRTSGDLLASGGAFRVPSEEDGATGAWQDQCPGSLQQQEEDPAHRGVTHGTGHVRGDKQTPRGTLGGTLCVRGCDLSRGLWDQPNPPQCSGASFGVGRPPGWARRPRGDRAAMAPTGLSPPAAPRAPNPSTPQGRGTLKWGPPAPNTAPRPWCPLPSHGDTPTALLPPQASPPAQTEPGSPHNLFIWGGSRGFNRAPGVPGR